MPEETFVKVKLSKTAFITLQPDTVVMLLEADANQLIADGHAEAVPDEE